MGWEGSLHNEMQKFEARREREKQSGISRTIMTITENSCLVGWS